MLTTIWDLFTAMKIPEDQIQAYLAKAGDCVLTKDGTFLLLLCGFTASLVPQEIRIDFAVMPETKSQGFFNTLWKVV